MNRQRIEILILAAALNIAALVHGDVMDVYNFNSPVNDADPSTGTFQSINHYGVMGWGSGTTGVLIDGAGSSDPNTSDNSAFGMIGFSPSPGGPDESEGFGFSVSVGPPDAPWFRDIHLTLDIMFTANSADRLQVQYWGADSLWHDFASVIGSTPGWTNGVALDFTGLPFANNNPGFEARFVTQHASAQGFQSPGGGAYAGGMIAFDNVVWSGTAIPEPGIGALLAGGLAVAGFRGAVRRWSAQEHGRKPGEAGASPKA